MSHKDEGYDNWARKAHRNAELENGPRMRKESKWAKDVQEEINGTKESTSNVMGQESPK